MSFKVEMPLKRLVVPLLFALAVLLVSTAVSATVMVYTDLARLVELSDVIVRGRVVDQKTSYDEERQEISTITTLQVQRVFHGEDVSDTVQFSQWGGAWEDRIARIPGDARFVPYEDVVLFLVDGKGKYAGMRYLTALSQSKFTVARSSDGTRVFRSLSDLAFLDPTTQDVSPRRDERYDYEAFVAELESLIAGIKGGKR